MMTCDELIAFEASIAEAFNAGSIRAPIHLDGGNEDALLRIFDEMNFNPGVDWCFCTWRSHYKALLAGVPAAKVRAAIMAGRSIALCFPEHRFYSSAIVAGNLPMALGVAGSLKRTGAPGAVLAFAGDMAARSGLFRECFDYAWGHRLPIHFVVEDNGKSVCTDTEEAWGGPADFDSASVSRYRYVLPWPHSGAGVRVQF